VSIPPPDLERALPDLEREPDLDLDLLPDLERELLLEPDRDLLLEPDLQTKSCRDVTTFCQFYV
jgi:hypothetical protein